MYQHPENTSGRIEAKEVKAEGEKGIERERECRIRKRNGRAKDDGKEENGKRNEKEQKEKVHGEEDVGRE